MYYRESERPRRRGERQRAKGKGTTCGDPRKPPRHAASFGKTNYTGVNKRGPSSPHNGLVTSIAKPFSGSSRLLQTRLNPAVGDRSFCFPSAVFFFHRRLFALLSRSPRKNRIWNLENLAQDVNPCSRASKIFFHRLFVLLFCLSVCLSPRETNRIWKLEMAPQDLVPTGTQDLGPRFWKVLFFLASLLSAMTTLHFVFSFFFSPWCINTPKGRLSLLS